MFRGYSRPPPAACRCATTGPVLACPYDAPGVAMVAAAHLKLCERTCMTEPSMRYRRLGRTNLQVSLLGLGGGGRSRLGRASNATPEDIHRLVRAALDLGINLFDTAADYGTEDILGDALRGVARDSVVISTKFGPTTRDGDFRDPADLRPTIERSLQRLHTDHVDVLYLHGVRADRYAAICERFLAPLQA